MNSEMTDNARHELNEVTHITDSAMTAAQLIELLQQADPDARVLFTCDYGDYSHTQQALPVSCAGDEESATYLRTSAYSQSGLALVRDEPQDWPEDEDFPVVILRG